MPIRDPLFAPTLEVALAASTSVWQTDLERLCRTAKDLFADVVWELRQDLDRDLADSDERPPEEVWGHKAVIYARAPPSFQARYFSFRPAPSGTPTPNSGYSPVETPEPDASVLSLVSPSSSPTPGMNGSVSLPAGNGLQRLPIPYNPLFASEIEHLYTGKGLPQAAFDFLFAPISSSSGAESTDPANDPIDKLRKDLVYMWRARLYSDVKIALTGDDANTKTHDGASAVFAAHKFVLAARSPYFYTQLVSWQQKPSSNPPSTDSSGDAAIQTISLPAPPFTPATLHFTLGYLYSGTLSFSHRTYDLATALALLKGAVYLQITELEDEVRMRVVEEMMHGLAFARLSKDEYEKAVEDFQKLNPETHTWAVNIPGSMCTCKTCARRAPRLLAFASAPDVTDPIILRGSTRILTNLVGAGWVNNEFATMGPTLHVSLLSSIKERLNPRNLLGLIVAVKEGLAKVDAPSKDKDLTDADRTVIRGLLLDVRAYADSYMCEQPHTTAFFFSPAFMSLIERNGAGFSDIEQIGLVCESIKRGVAPPNAGKLYAALLENVLLQTKTSPHGDPTADLLLPVQSPLKAPLEETRHALIEWLKPRWKGVRLQGGFGGVDRWVVAEIAGEIDVRVEELYDPTPIQPLAVTRLSKAESGQKVPLKSPPPRTSNFGVARSTRTNGTYSSAPFPVSYMGSTVSKKTNGSKEPPRTKSIAASTHSNDSSVGPIPSSGQSQVAEAQRISVAETSEISETASFVSARTTRTARPSRPNSPIAPSVIITETNGETAPPEEEIVEQAPVVTAATTPSPAPPASPAISVRSLNQSVSQPTSPVTKTLLRKVTPSTSSISSLNRPRPHTNSLTPMTRSSTVSNASTTVKTANAAAASVNKSQAARSRTNSVASVASVSSVRTTRTNATAVSTTTPRTSRLSMASKASVTPTKATLSKLSVPSSVPSKSTTTKSIKKSPSLSSVRSAASVRSTTSVSPSTTSGLPKKTVLRKVVPVVPVMPEVPKVPSPAPEETAPVIEESAPVLDDSVPAPEEPVYVKEVEPPNTDVAMDTDSTTKTNGVRKKASTETVRTAYDHENTPTKRAKLTPGLRSDDLGDRPHIYSIVRGEPTGSTLAIGIPCIVAARRRRFRAFARYIGEVTGEAGPWVGIEVPASSADETMTNSWADQGDGDGTWHGVRYFDLSDSHKLPVKRGGDQLSLRELKRVRSRSPTISELGGISESRGLFVRPGQVLYVVEAVDDL